MVSLCFFDTDFVPLAISRFLYVGRRSAAKTPVSHILQSMQQGGMT